jgi:hypothetical protein
LDKDNHDLYNDRGSSNAELGDLDKALADFEAIALKPDYALGHANRGWVLTVTQARSPPACSGSVSR